MEMKLLKHSLCTVGTTDLNSKESLEDEPSGKPAMYRNNENLAKVPIIIKIKSVYDHSTNSK
jgi:hypothetical protein